MSADSERLLPPNEPKAFESLCFDLWKEIWSDPEAKKHGRSGQPQASIDVFGRSRGKWVGVQCKQKDGLLRTKLTPRELEVEIRNALKFKPKLAKFILATSGPRDVKLQEQARQITTRHRGKHLFSVEVWSWEDIWHEVYEREALLRRVGPVYWPRYWKLIEEGLVRRQNCRARPSIRRLSAKPKLWREKLKHWLVSDFVETEGHILRGHFAALSDPRSATKWQPRGGEVITHPEFPKRPYYITNWGYQAAFKLAQTHLNKWRPITVKAILEHFDGKPWLQVIRDPNFRKGPTAHPDFAETVRHTIRATELLHLLEPNRHSTMNYYCKYCGTKNSSIASLTAATCFRHPAGANKGKHALYEGDEKTKYECKHCGNNNSSLSSLTAAPCFRHPLGANKGHHEPAL